jgi:hypothetical protein
MDLFFQWIHQAIVNGWRPSPEASPAEIRRLGVRLAGLGYVMLAIGVVGFAIVKRLLGPQMAAWDIAADVGTLCSFPGMAAVIVGGYRALGTEPTRDDSSATGRLVVGVGVGCLGLVLALPFCSSLSSSRKAEMSLLPGSALWAKTRSVEAIRSGSHAQPTTLHLRRVRRQRIGWLALCALQGSPRRSGGVRRRLSASVGRRDVSSLAPWPVARGPAAVPGGR